MAKFKVKTTFTIKQRGMFVIAGEIQEGEINKGMKVICHDEENDEFQFVINDVNFLDGFDKDGKIQSDVALCIDSVAPALYKIIFTDKILDIK